MLEDGGKVIAKGTAQRYTAFQPTSRAARKSVAGTRLDARVGRSYEPLRDTSLLPPLDFRKTKPVCTFRPGRRIEFEAWAKGKQLLRPFFIGLEVASELRDR